MRGCAVGIEVYVKQIGYGPGRRPNVKLVLLAPRPWGIQAKRQWEAKWSPNLRDLTPHGKLYILVSRNDQEERVMEPTNEDEDFTSQI